MSELKAKHVVDVYDVYSSNPYNEAQVYLKSEADKVIADLEESHKMEVGQLWIEIANLKKACNDKDDWCRHTLKENRHHKYKRCLAMAEMCHWKMGVFIYKEEKSNFYQRWHKRWSMLAEKFKEAK